MIGQGGGALTSTAREGPEVTAPLTSSMAWLCPLPLDAAWARTARSDRCFRGRITACWRCEKTRATEVPRLIEELLRGAAAEGRGACDLAAQLMDTAVVAMVFLGLLVCLELLECLNAKAQVHNQAKPGDKLSLAGGTTDPTYSFRNNKI